MQVVSYFLEYCRVIYKVLNLKGHRIKNGIPPIMYNNCMSLKAKKKNRYK